MLELSTPVKYVKRIGERIAATLATRGVETVEDLLYHLPFRYEDRLHPRPISELQPGEMARHEPMQRGHHGSQDLYFKTADEMSALFADPRVAQDLTPREPSDSWKDPDSSSEGD